MAKLSRIGQYKLVRKLGQGGMGMVFEGLQESLDRRVAIKILPADFMRDPVFVERFQREAKAAARLNHPNIVTIYEIGNDQGFHFYSMELVDGQSLRERLEERGRLDVAEVLDLMLQTIRGLSHAWEQQIVHRDIKPDNLMLTKAGLLKIADLGLARVRHTLGTMTQTGAGMGTPYYMSPEQAQDAKNVDLRSDVYSLGATFYHLLTGRVPFEGSSPFEVVIKVATAQFPPVCELRPDVPASVATVIEKMLARKPDDRFQNARELLESVESLNRPAPLVTTAPLNRVTGSETVRANVVQPPHQPTTGVDLAALAGQASASTPTAPKVNPIRFFAKTNRNPVLPSTPKSCFQSGMAENWGCAALSPDGRTVAVTSHKRQGLISICDIATEKSIQPFQAHSESISALTFTMDGRALATSAGDEFKLWSSPSMQPVSGFRPPTFPKNEYIRSLAFSVDGKTLAARHHDEFRFFSPQDGTQLGELRVANEFCGNGGVVFSKCGRILAASFQSGHYGAICRTRIYTLPEGEALITIEHNPEISLSMAIAPDSSWLAANVWLDRSLMKQESINSVKVWSLTDGRLLATHVEGADGREITITPDGRTLFRACGKYVMAYSVPSLERHGDLRSIPSQMAGGNVVVFLAVSSDGNNLVTLLNDGQIVTWDISKLREVNQS